MCILCSVCSVYVLYLCFLCSVARREKKTILQHHIMIKNEEPSNAFWLIWMWKTEESLFYPLIVWHFMHNIILAHSSYNIVVDSVWLTWRISLFMRLPSWHFNFTKLYLCSFKLSYDLVNSLNVNASATFYIHMTSNAKLCNRRVWN